MYKDDLLFGHDGRYKPPLPKLLTARGFGGSHGRLAYTGFNRNNAYNMSEYAYTKLGMMPYRYVIVNDRAVDYDPDTALRVDHHRVAIPVKEFAEARHLSLQEQWELMHPRWVGTFFTIEDTYRSRRKNYVEALTDAILSDQEDDFFADFWNPRRHHEKAIERVNRWHNALREDIDSMTLQMDRLTAEIKRITSELESPFHADDDLEKRKRLESLRRECDHLSTKLLEKQKQLDRTERFLQNYDY